jgi:transposase InsO family protein
MHGPSASVATLQAWCPRASRRAIAAWLTDDRRGRRQRLHVVRWHRPGRVWAMDFSEAPQPIDGAYRYLLQVRDLASQYHLAALPVSDTTAATACGLLRALCVDGNAPIVLKVDNGSAFISADLRAWAAAAGTQLLYSPPRYPRYNGAIEASIAAITTRAHHVAAAAGHPESWTCQTVEHARNWANGIVRRPSGQSAAAAWIQATPITQVERRRFLRACAATRRRSDDNGPSRMHHRVAIVDTLRRLKYVSITRRADLLHRLKTRTRQELRA